MGEKQALDPSPQSAISSARGALSTCEDAAAAPEPGTSSARHHERLWMMGG